MYPDGYPGECLVVELSSNTLDKSLLSRLSELAIRIVSLCWAVRPVSDPAHHPAVHLQTQDNRGSAQLVPVATELQKMVSTNKLLWAWPEVKRIKQKLKKKVRECLCFLTPCQRASSRITASWY